MDLNKVLLMGNLTRDPELRYINSGTAVCKLGLAVNRRYKRQDGEQAEETCFVDIVVWGRQGETCNQYLKKGAGVFIDGRLSWDSWEKDGQKRSKHEVVADRVQFMPRAGGGGGGGGGQRQEVSDYGSSHQSDAPPQAPGPEYDTEVPF